MNKKQMLEAYKKMLRIRLVEERLVKLYLERNIRSFVHFYIGQEAIAVGVCMNLKKHDYAFGTHRCHGHYLAKGGSLKRMVAELLGKSTGCSQGRGGSMHLVDRSVGYMGSVSILSSVVPISAGAAFSAKNAGRGGVSVVFVGDGATDEGSFYETINLAALMKLPVLFVVENNLYAGMSDEAARHPKEYDLGKIVPGLGAEYRYTNGNDITEIYDKVEWAKSNLPAVIECGTYRHMAHSAPIFDDKLGYRKVDDLKTRLKACPLKRITDNYFFEPEIIEIMKAEINHEIDKAIRFADKSPMPKPSELTNGVYYE